jgi:hypothetical protein
MAGAGLCCTRNRRRLRERSTDCHQRCEAAGREAGQRASDQADRIRTNRGQRRIVVVRPGEPPTACDLCGGRRSDNRWRLHGGGPSGCGTMPGESGRESRRRGHQRHSERRDCGCREASLHRQVRRRACARAPILACIEFPSAIISLRKPFDTALWETSDGSAAGSGA